MRFWIFLLVASLTSCLTAQEAPESRQWQSAAGTKIEAALAGFASDGKVILRKPDGSEIRVLPKQLSAADQTYLEEQKKAAERADAPRKIFFIGNSYTGGIRKMVTGLIAASPHKDCELVFLTPGGKTLAFHLENKQTMDKIREGNWDRIVLQDQSQTPAVFPDKFAKAAAGIDKIIDEADSRPVFYETWGRRDGDKMNAHMFPTYESMQKALTNSYGKAAKSCEADLAPVGQAWASVRKQSPELGKELYAKDGSHPAGPGAYLAACVFYATFFGEDPSTVDFDGGLPAEKVAILRKAAVEANLERD